MTDEQLDKIIEAIGNGFHFNGDKIDDVGQMVKAVGLAQIELPNGYDVSAALEQININFKGI
jgi:hypothetical protein